MDITHRLQAIIQFYRRHQRMPTLRDLRHLYGFKSVRAAEKVAGKLIEARARRQRPHRQAASYPLLSGYSRFRRHRSGVSFPC